MLFLTSLAAETCKICPLYFNPQDSNPKNTQRKKKFSGEKKTTAI